MSLSDAIWFATGFLFCSLCFYAALQIIAFRKEKKSKTEFAPTVTAPQKPRTHQPHEPGEPARQSKARMAAHRRKW